MRRASKSTKGSFDSSNTGNEIHTSDAMLASPIADEPYAGEVTQKERAQLIAEAAYYRAERRNFAPGCELADWLDAEAEIESIDSHPR